MIFVGERLAAEEGLPLDFGDFRVSSVLGVRGAVTGCWCVWGSAFVVWGSWMADSGSA